MLLKVVRSIVRRGGRVAEGACLESKLTGNCYEGSNPFLSANLRMLAARRAFLFAAISDQKELLRLNVGVERIAFVAKVSK
jgi:hypothetical protein